jgi:hypothetical protein
LDPWNVLCYVGTTCTAIDTSILPGLYKTMLEQTLANRRMTKNVGNVGKIKDVKIYGRSENEYYEDSEVIY